MHCKEINNSLLKLKRWVSAHWFCYYDKVLWKKRILWYHFVTYKLLENYEKWNNWNLKALTFKALKKKKKALVPCLYTPFKKSSFSWCLIHYTTFYRPNRAFVKKIPLFYQFSYCITTEMFLYSFEILKFCSLKC